MAAISSTPEQIQAFRTASQNQIQQQLGLNGIAKNKWTYDQRVSYLKALASYYLDHQSSLAQGDIDNATKILRTNFTPLESYTYSQMASDFVDEVAENANDVVSSLPNAVKYTLLSVVVLVGVIVVYNVFKIGEDLRK